MKHAFSHFRHFEQPQTEEISSQISRRAGALTRNDGFSLVELSIVLVILGLLTGGILTGQSLIRAAELRSVTTEFQTYQTAVQTFRDKYFAIPGDMTNATDFWGAINATHSTCIAAASPDNQLTCNGDGDGYINRPTTYAGGGYERYHFWLHLANAGLIEGRFNGLTSSAGTFAYESGVNSPTSKLGAGAWTIVSYIQDHTDNAHANRFPRVFDFTTQYSLVDAQVTPAEMWGLDTKIDDGLPATGRVFNYKASGAGAGCTTSDAIDATYALDTDEQSCDIVIGN